MSNNYVMDLTKRLAQAEQWARLIEANRPEDHQSISRAWAYVRRLKAQIREGAAR